MRNVFIIGSKGIPASYGGFETFVDELISRQVSKNIKYHVSCLGNENKEFEYNGAHCFSIKVPNIGAAKAIYYDVKSVQYCMDYIIRNNLKGSIIYILACRIGPFINRYVQKLHNMDCKVYVNPDGHEWKRAKWNYIIRKYWKVSERLMVKHADLLVCDSINIENYIREDYSKYNPNTTFIAYGADTQLSILKDDDEKLTSWYKDKNIKNKNYYLVVGRFVPENNYETMIREFMQSKTKKDFVLITNVENNKFYDILKEKTGFYEDKRIKFVGTVYDKQLLKKIRENAFAYLHGHEVGGTNPSLLEALATTDLNLLLDVGFNREVGEDGALYWNKLNNDLSELINTLDEPNSYDKKGLASNAKDRINNYYGWDLIVNKYENLFK